MLEIEARTMNTMISTQVLPTALRYQAELADVVSATQAAGVECPDTEDAVRTMVGLVSEMRAGLAQVNKTIENPPADHYRHAQKLNEELMPAMNRVRQASDAAERMIPADLWPLPTYAQMLLMDR